ncbi:hypothetical protein RJT34_01011 [Clitoria ternatea]|uniref:Uncharacterized protein n=1 Tax=Clitoria ternatea TaxID=43366 RepID=A0AAN9KIK4_CLITE
MKLANDNDMKELVRIGDKWGNKHDDEAIVNEEDSKRKKRKYVDKVKPRSGSLRKMKCSEGVRKEKKLKDKKIVQGNKEDVVHMSRFIMQDQVILDDFQEVEESEDDVAVEGYKSKEYHTPNSFMFRSSGFSWAWA